MELNSDFEIFIGVVAPLGTERKWFLKSLEEKFKSSGYQVIKISITDEIIKFTGNDNRAYSFEYFVKMEICNELRKEYSNGFLMGIVINRIRELRKNKNQKIIYIIDQIKNVNEYNVLSHVYGLNYLQISLFSNESFRDGNLKTKFKNDCVKNLSEYKFKPNSIKFFDESNNARVTNLFTDVSKGIFSKFEDQILPDVTHNLIKKDFHELVGDSKFNGQQVSDLFHLSHYFFNLDDSKVNISKELNKFISLVEGNNEDYPTQDEFGMSLAFQVSVRSNFPNNRHIGAAILSPYGEVISVASIRAPCPSSNPTLFDQYQVQDGYMVYKDKITQWKEFLNEHLMKCNDLDLEERNKLSDISNFLNDSLDFHPCTHAEIAAIIDAAKLGISVRKSTLYTTTFPCHLCAKEIINAGISKVIYLEAYPKSKNKELYPKLIDFDPSHTSSLLPFSFYSGVGPKRFMYVYSVKNKNKFSDYPPLIAYERNCYYEKKEDDVLNYLSNGGSTSLSFLDPLFRREDE
ncbi:deaminase [Legionella pneumophila serogroup 1]